MTFTPIEIIALAFVILSLVKIFVILVNKTIWYKDVALPIYEHHKTSSVIFGLLALIIFFYIIQELTIIQIFAVMGLFSMLIALGYMQYYKEFQSLMKQIYSQRVTPFLIVYTILWLGLLFWALYEILL